MAMVCPVNAATTGLGKVKISYINLMPRSLILEILSISPDAKVFKSKPAEKIPSLPLRTNDPLSFGTSFKQLLIASSISTEKTFTFPSSRLIIETSSIFSSVA